jgi:regulatory protein
MDTDIVNNTAWIITTLDADPRNPDRVLVTIAPADEQALGSAISPAARTLALHIAVVARSGLRAGLELEALQLAELRAADEFQRIYTRALDFLAVRPRSEWEVRDRLRRKGIADEDTTRVLERLRQVGYLDDAAFARYWIGERARSSPRGPRLLQQELRRKRVDSAVIAQALADFETDRQEAAVIAQEETSDMDEETADPQFTEALALAQRKHRTYANLDEPTYRRRMSGFLLRRGYSYGLVSKVLKALRADADDD